MVTSSKKEALKKIKDKIYLNSATAYLSQSDPRKRA